MLAPSSEIAPEAISQAARRIGPYFGVFLKIDKMMEPDLREIGQAWSAIRSSRRVRS